jgi:peptidoglycan/xylan/chitin deacetylase (PgdA/CDA1 family)
VAFALIYHDIAAAADRDAIGIPGPVAARYKLEPDRFEEHLDAIEAAGVSVAPWRSGGDDAAVLTFDDGGASALDAADALERRGWRGHFFVTTGRVGTPGFLSAAGVRELAERGHPVGAHSHSHPTYFGGLSRDEQAEEWTRSRGELGEILGAEPEGASVPGGFFTPTVAETAAAAGFRWLMTSHPSARETDLAGIPVIGRYTIWASTSPAQAAGYARGARLPRARLWLEWTAKQRAKRISPRAFEAARRVRARVSS